MDINRLKEAVNKLSTEDIVRNTLTKFPKEDDILNNALSELKLITCTPDMFSDTKIHAVNNEYNFGILLIGENKPTGAYLDTAEAYYYVLNENDKTITQTPKYSKACACYYPIEDIISVKTSDEYVELSNTIDFKSTTLSVTDEDIEHFKKFATAHKNWCGTIFKQKSRIDLFYETISAVFKPYVDAIPEKVIRTKKSRTNIHLNNEFLYYYTIYIKGSYDGMRLLAVDELEGKQEEFFGEFDNKHITAEVKKTFENLDLGETLENLLYDFFSENSRAKDEPEFEITFGVYLYDDDDGEQEFIKYKFEGNNFIVNTQPVKVMAAVSSKYYHFSTFYNWDLLEIKIPEVVIPMSKNVIKYYVDKKIEYVYFTDSHNAFDIELSSIMCDILEPKFKENNIKIISVNFSTRAISDNYNCAHISFTIKNPLLQGE